MVDIIADVAKRNNRNTFDYKSSNAENKITLRLKVILLIILLIILILQV